MPAWRVFKQARSRRGEAAKLPRDSGTTRKMHPPRRSSHAFTLRLASRNAPPPPPLSPRVVSLLTNWRAPHNQLPASFDERVTHPEPVKHWAHFAGRVTIPKPSFPPPFYQCHPPLFSFLSDHITVECVLRCAGILHRAQSLTFQ